MMPLYGHAHIRTCSRIARGGDALGNKKRCARSRTPSRCASVAAQSRTVVLRPPRWTVASLCVSSVPRRERYCASLYQHVQCFLENKFHYSIVNRVSSFRLLTYPTGNLSWIVRARIGINEDHGDAIRDHSPPRGPHPRAAVRRRVHWPYLGQWA